MQSFHTCYIANMETGPLWCKRKKGDIFAIQMREVPLIEFCSGLFRAVINQGLCSFHFPVRWSWLGGICTYK